MPPDLEQFLSQMEATLDRLEKSQRWLGVLIGATFCLVLGNLVLTAGMALNMYLKGAP